MKVIYQGNNNCFATCIASILECDIEDVDVVIPENGNASELYSAILKKEKLNGYKFLYFPFDCFDKCSLYPISVGTLCILNVISGKVDDKNINHAVVGKIENCGNIRVIHNPKKKISERISL